MKMLVVVVVVVIDFYFYFYFLFDEMVLMEVAVAEVVEYDLKVITHPHLYQEGQSQQ